MRQVVVTGGGTGIGRSIAEAFAGHGDQVVVTGRRRDVLEQTAAELGRHVRAVAFDAADPAEVEGALARLPERVDVLVNNAGGNTDIGAEAHDGLAGVAAAWRANLDVNLMSAVLVTTALRARLVAGGAVVSLSSIAAHRGGSGSYGAAKAAVEAWNLTLAQELGEGEVTANVIAPGYVEGTEFFRGRMTPQRRSALVAETAGSRVGTPTDITATVVFLASAAARHITGQVLHVNGGAFAGR